MPWVATDFSACHNQVVRRVRWDSQAGFCWHIWDLHLSAGEICTAEVAGGGRRTDVEERLVGNRGKMGLKGGEELRK